MVALLSHKIEATSSWFSSTSSNTLLSCIGCEVTNDVETYLASTVHCMIVCYFFDTHKHTSKPREKANLKPIWVIAH